MRDIMGMMGKVKEMLEKGRGVILDQRGLNDADYRLLREAIEREGMSDSVTWYP